MGVTIPHTMTSGMGGLRTAGDLVARMQMTRGMKLNPAKQYVADRLGISLADLHDEVVMREVREDQRIGGLRSLPGQPKGIEAKHRIAKLLDITINCVDLFKQRSA